MEHEMMELTTEQITKSVSAAYDSVNLINELKTKTTLSEEDSDSLSRNKEHLKIMFAKGWFLSALTPAQKIEIQNI